MFTRKTNDPNYYAFFPADIERAFSGTNFQSEENAGRSLMKDDSRPTLAGAES